MLPYFMVVQYTYASVHYGFPIRKAPRLYKVLIKIPFVGDYMRRQKGITLDNLTSLQILGTPSGTASPHATLHR